LPDHGQGRETNEDREEIEERQRPGRDGLNRHDRDAHEERIAKQEASSDCLFRVPAAAAAAVDLRATAQQVDADGQAVYEEEESGDRGCWFRSRWK